jgi:hypothetical protein
MSFGYRQKEVNRLREEMETLVTQAVHSDKADDKPEASCRGNELPVEWECRAQRFATTETAMHRLEAQAKADAEAE